MSDDTRMTPSRLARHFDLTSMSTRELRSLAEQIDRELDGRAFEENLKREVDSHLQKQQWIQSHSAGNNRRRRRF
ncbi:MAG TPA: hypothetical protein VKA32_09515 [Gammaproteobacteria bacterium]|nr:hypothetical protein [Gammaproteobacteria bacterium]